MKIALLAVLYVVIGVGVARLAFKVFGNEEDRDEPGFMGGVVIFWPLMFLCMIWYALGLLAGARRIK